MAKNAGVREGVVAATRRGLPAIALAGVLFVVFGAYYFYYIRLKSAYVVSRDMRILSSAGMQLDQTLRAKSQTIKNFAEQGSWCEENGQPIVEYRRSAEEHWLDPFMGDMDAASRTFPAPPVAGQSGQRIVSNNGRLELETEYFGTVNQGSCAPNGTVHAVGRTSFENILKEIFEPMSAFDSVMLVRGDGTVLFQSQPVSPFRRVGGLGRVPHSENPAVRNRTPLAPDLIINQLSSLRERVGWKADQPLSMDHIRGASRQLEVTLSGSAYVLLSQPYMFNAPRNGTSNDDWLICAVIAKSRFTNETMQISTSVLAVVAALLLLTMCAGPFLKLSLLGDQQPVTRSDVMLTGMALLFATSIITLAVVDTIAYQQVKTIADDEQRTYADRLEHDLDRNIVLALGLSDALRQWSLENRSADLTPGGLFHEGIGKLKNEKSLTSLYDVRSNPWFTSFAWIDKNDKHCFRGFMDGGTPPLLDLSTRAYVRETREHPWNWRIPDWKFLRDRIRNGSKLQIPKGPPVRKIYIDAGRTLTTGRPETVFAVPTGDPDKPVFAVTMPFISFADPVTPPGLRFAIVDDGGRVLYHSDRSRVGIENVFAETDQNRQLQSAMSSRNEEFVDVSYWGEDHRAFVRPLRDVPWTLLTFRDKRMLRTMNFQALVMTLVLLLLYQLSWAMVFGLFGFARPNSRMSWLWPDERREQDWRRLYVILLLSAVAAAIGMFFYDSGARLAMSFLAPVQIVLTAYIVLRRRRSGVNVALSAMWVVITLLFISGIIGAHIDRELMHGGTEWYVRGLVLALTLAAIGLTLRSSPAESGSVPWRSHARAYVACGVLTLLILSALPTIGFFNTSNRLTRESVMRYGQLLYSEELQRRLEELLVERRWSPTATAERTWSSDAAEAVAMANQLPEFFESLWCIQKALPGGTLSPCDATSTAMLHPEWRPDTSARWKPATDRLAELVEEFVPRYSDDAAALRDLHHPGATDESWRWIRSGRAVALVRNLTFSTEASKKLARFATMLDNEIEKRPGEQYKQKPRWDFVQRAQLVIISRLPRLVHDAVLPADSIGPYAKPAALHPLPQHLPEHDLWILVASVFIIALILPLHGLVRFVARRVFVYDVSEPSWLASAPIRPILGEHLFLIHQTRPLDKLVAINGFETISFEKLHTDGNWDSEILRLESADGPRDIVINDFAWKSEDLAISKHKLEFLERLVQVSNRTLIVASKMYQASFLACVHQPGRWSALFLSFIDFDERRIPAEPEKVKRLPSRARLLKKTFSLAFWKTAWRKTRAGFLAWLEQTRRDLRDLRNGIRTRAFWKAEVKKTWNNFLALLDTIGLWPHPFTNRKWLTDEAAKHPVLQSLSRDLRNVAIMGREQLADDFGEAAETYYRAIWTPCSPAERLLLYQIARYGYVNPNHRRNLRRLMARGLVVRAPEICIFNETFRRFVLARGVEVMNETPVAEASAWDRLRVPLLVGIASAAVFFVATQKELLTASSAIVAALTTGLPAMVKLVGLFTDRRSAAPVAD